MTRLLLGTSAAGLIALAGCAAIIHAKNVEERRLRDAIDGHEACASAVAKSDLTASAARCSEAVAAVHARAVQTIRCDQALLTANLPGVSWSCSTEVKAVVADRDAASRERDNLSDLLARVRSDQAAAITRAEARGLAQAQRTTSAQDRLNAAPRSDAGLGRCDAECLQRLGGD